MNLAWWAVPLDVKSCTRKGSVMIPTSEGAHPVPLFAALRAGASVFPRQQDHVVGEVECDFRERKIGVVELLPINLSAVAVLANDGAAMLAVDCEFPDLKRLGADRLFVPLRNGNDVEQPVSAAMLGNVLGSIRV